MLAVNFRVLGTASFPIFAFAEGWTQKPRQMFAVGQWGRMFLLSPNSDAEQKGKGSSPRNETNAFPRTQVLSSLMLLCLSVTIRL